VSGDWQLPGAGRRHDLCALRIPDRNSRNTEEPPRRFVGDCPEAEALAPLSEVRELEGISEVVVPTGEVTWGVKGTVLTKPRPRSVGQEAFGATGG